MEPANSVITIRSLAMPIEIEESFAVEITVDIIETKADDNKIRSPLKRKNEKGRNLNQTC